MGSRHLRDRHLRRWAEQSPDSPRLGVGWRQIAEQRFRDQAVSAAITTIGLLLVAALPLTVAIYLLRAVRGTETSDTVLTEVLVDELLAEKPRLLPRPETMQIDAARKLLDAHAEGESDADDSTQLG